MKPRLLIIDTDATAGQAVRSAVSVLDCEVDGPKPFSELSEASLVLLTPPEGELASATVARIRERFPRTGVIVLTEVGLDDRSGRLLQGRGHGLCRATCEFRPSGQRRP